MNPKVFISHASEDKERFVLRFAERLRAKGIDAWIDKWEMLPGDSLVDKIFEEGIKNAQAVIVVLSSYSLNKKWVREELNAAVVKKINEGSKLIPVIIDDCEIPESLKSTLWVRIGDLENYDGEFERIVMSIYEESAKPPLGEAPIYAKTILDIVPGLERVDSIVLKLSCEFAIEIKHDFVGDVQTLLQQAKLQDISEEQFYESLEILDARNYIDGRKVFDGTDRIHHFTLTRYGLEQYAKVYVKDYDKLVHSVGLQIINQNEKDSVRISARLQIPLLLVNHIISSFADIGCVKTVESHVGDFNIQVYETSPELKRRLR
jgi:hypothetical protein